MKLDENDPFENFISTICLRMNRLPDEIENKRMSVILRTFAYIKKEEDIKRERMEEQSVK